MQIKGLIRFFTIVLSVVCLYQLSFTIAAKMIEGKADKIAHAKLATVPANLTGEAKVSFEDSIEEIAKFNKRNYLDSIASKPFLDVWGLKEIYNYKYCREHQISLGLDLKGGMSLVMEIAQDDVLRKLSNNNKSASFNKALEMANDKQKSDNRDYLTLFAESFKQIAPNDKLAAIFATNQSYQGKLSFNSTNDEVVNAIKGDVDASVKNTFNVLKTRIDKFGVASPNISLQSNSGRILLELPGVDDPTRVRKLLQQTAQLEFWDCYEVEEALDYFGEANKVLGAKFALKKEANIADTTAAATPTDTAASVASELLGVKDTGAAKVDTSKKAATAKKDTAASKATPLWDVFRPNVVDNGKDYGQGPVMGYALGKDTAKLNKYLAFPEVKAVFPRDLRLLWGAKAMGKDASVYALYAIKQNPATPEPPLAGDAIVDATQGHDNISGSWEVNLTMNSMGAAKWEKMTDNAVNSTVNGKPRKRCIAIVLDNRVFSAPVVQSKISGGHSQINGIYDQEEALDLANILKSGKLEAKTKVIEEQVIGPSLGKESINAGLMSLFVGFIVVFLFMVAYYSSSGIVANCAMILNLFLIIGVLASIPGAALTLPGMAGIVLTLGMAVDANVIINERIREELARGKGYRLAIEEGYKHSYSAIIDGNVTTTIVAFVLLFFGLGPVKGFATVLVIGLFSSVFTAVLVSRLFFDYIFKKNWTVEFGNKYTIGLFKHINFDFLGKRKIAYALSTTVFSICFASSIFYGFDLGVDFKGGRSYVVKFDQDVKTNEVATALEKTLGGIPLVKTYGSNNQISITTAYMIDSKDPGTDSIIEARLFQGLTPFYLNRSDFKTFRDQKIKSSTKIESSIADDIRRSAWWAGFFGLLGVFLYIFLRFKKWQYALGAVVATIHDPIIVLGLYSLLRRVVPFSLEVDQNVVAAILTLIGYSVNDTVVVFDRIREFMGLYPTRSLVQNVNDSINTTLSRTIMTSMTVFLVALILFVFGGDAIRGFSFALIIGVAVGTYSSIFVASPIMVDLLLRKQNSEVKK